MRTVVVGNRALAKHVLRHLLETDWNVVGAVATAGEAARRQAGYTPFGEVAGEFGVPVLEIEDINRPEAVEELSNLDPDWCICPGWHQIIDEAVLAVPRRGFVGFHASDLPGGRGGAPVNWAIINGESQIPLSLFEYSAGIDAGDVVRKGFVDVEDRDDVGTVLEKLATAACDLLDAERSDFEAGSLDASPQPMGAATYRPRRRPQDGLIDWSSPQSAVVDWIRAQTDPYPGAYTFLDGERLIVWKADVVEGPAREAAPGTIVDVVNGQGLDVAVNDGVVRVTRVQLGEGPRWWADELSRRRGLERGHSLGTSSAPSGWLYTGIEAGDGGTDFSEATNVPVGSKGRVQAVVETVTPQRVSITSTLDGDVVREVSRGVSARSTVDVEYTPGSEGRHSLRVEFRTGEELVDVRHLDVFAVRE